MQIFNWILLKPLPYPFEPMFSAKAILLDLDDTLYAYSPCHQAGLDAFSATWENLNLGDQEEALKYYHVARKEIHATLKGSAASHHRLLYVQRALEKRLDHLDVKKTLKLYDAYWSAYLETMVLSTGAREWLEWLQSKKIPVVIVTNLVTEIQFEKICKLGIEGLIQFIVTSEESGHEKPHTDPFLLALKKLNIPIDPDVYVVGDSFRADVTGAQSLGLSWIWIASSHEDKIVSELPEQGICVHSFEELITMMEE